MSWLMVIGTALTSATMGQTAATRVGVVNLTAVFERYSMTKDLEDLFTQRRDAIATEAQSRRENITFKRNELQQFKPGTQDYREREEALVRAEIEFQVWLEVQERSLKDEHKSWLLSIYRNVQKEVAAIANERGLDLVLTQNALDIDAPDSMALKQQILLRTVLFANDRTSLTDALVVRLDAEYEKNGGIATLGMKSPPNTAPKKPSAKP